MTQFSNGASETNHLSSPNSDVELGTLVRGVREEVLRVAEQLEIELAPLNISERSKPAGGHLSPQKTL